MGDDGATKAAAATGLKQIARLRELLHRWQQAMALGGSKPPRDGEEGHDGGGAPDDQELVASAIPPFVLQRLRRTETVDSLLSDDESCHSPEPPPDVPRGYCPVYVGPEQRRFVIPTGYLAHPVFRLLLDKAEEEFGFRHEGALAIPCETEAFKYILQCVERHDNGLAADAQGTNLLGRAHDDQLILIPLATDSFLMPFV
jgi:SAUR family protein